MDENEMFRRSIYQANYEINQTITQIEHEQGELVEVGIGIFLNAESDGAEEDFTEEIANTIVAGVGLPTAATRISVVMLPFAHGDTAMADMFERMEREEASLRNRQLLETILMYATIALLGVMVLLLGRTLIRAIKPPPEPEPVLVAAGPDGIDFLIGDDDEFGIDEPGLEEIDLQSKSAGLEQIERFIDKDSASVAQLLRNWLTDE